MTRQAPVSFTLVYDFAVFSRTWYPAVQEEWKRAEVRKAKFRRSSDLNRPIMDRSKDIRPQIEALERRRKTTPDDDTAGNHKKIVIEAMSLYQTCKMKYIHFKGEIMVSGCSAGVIVLGVIAPSCATCLTFTVGAVVYFARKRSQWKIWWRSV